MIFCTIYEQSHCRVSSCCCNPSGSVKWQLPGKALLGKKKKASCELFTRMLNFGTLQGIWSSEKRGASSASDIISWTRAILSWKSWCFLCSTSFYIRLALCPFSWFCVLSPVADDCFWSPLWVRASSALGGVVTLAPGAPSCVPESWGSCLGEEQWAALTECLKQLEHNLLCQEERARKKAWGVLIKAPM